MKEIRIHRDRNVWDVLDTLGSAILDPLCGTGPYCFPGPLTLLLLPVALGAEAVTAPFVLSIEGIKSRRIEPSRDRKGA
jgi:hypothetical protein